MIEMLIDAAWIAAMALVAIMVTRQGTETDGPRVNPLDYPEGSDGPTINEETVA